jgi:hypothetical protein
MDWLKLDNKGILRGSLAQSDYTTQLIWIKMLAMANETRDRDGYLRYAIGKPYSLEYIAQICNVTMAELENAIDLFEDDVRAGKSRIQFAEDGSIFLSNWNYYQTSSEKRIAKQIAIAKAKQTKRTADNVIVGLGRTVNELTSAVKDLKNNKEK